MINLKADSGSDEINPVLNALDELEKKFESLNCRLAEQNRELEIEAALEKVRVCAMAMKEPADMLDVCRIISEQFELLGVREIRNVQTAIFYQTKGAYLNYEYYRLYKQNFITEVEYDLQPDVAAFVNQMLKDPSAFFTRSFKREELSDWIEYQRKASQFIDPALNSSDSLHYYFYSIGQGALGLSTYNIPLTEKELYLLKRFRNVFELAYRRFVDIEQAIAQAKEAQVEAALEKVRASAMNMNNSGDLSAAASLVFTELQRLGINSIRCGVILLSENSRTALLYAAAASPDSDALALIGNMEVAGHPVFDRQYEHWLKKENYFTELEDEELNSYYNVLYSKLQIPYTPDEHKKKEYGYYFSFSQGMFYTWTRKPYSATEINILNRFKTLIDLTFRRYLDLKKAEAQAKEAQIEAALERVRVEAMGMRNPDELLNICEAQFTELKKLGFTEIRNTLITVFNDEKGSFLDYDYSDYSGGYITDISYNSHPTVDYFIQQIKSANDAFAEIAIEGNKLKEWNEFRKESGQKDDPRLDNIPALYYYFYSIGIGAIGISTFNSITDEKREILKRFRNVFDFAYRRYKDIALAEAQAREAKIEAALERVRSKTMGMQHSNELSETSFVLFKQLKELGEIAEQISIAIVNEQENMVYLYTTFHGNEWKHVRKFEIDLEIPVLRDIYKAWKARDRSIVIDLSDTGLLEYNKFRIEKIGRILDSGIDYTSDRWTIHAAFFSQGMLSFSTRSPRPRETVQLLERFAAVFNLAYTRFLDLKNSEAQALEAMRRATLDRVRAEIASMRAAEDLERVIPIIWRELTTLGIPFIRCGVFIVDKEEKKVRVFLSTPEGTSLGVLNLPIDINDVTSNVVEQWRKKNIYRLHWTKEEFIQWTQSMLEKGQIQSSESYQGSANPPDSLDMHFVPFCQGMLYVGNTSLLTDEHIRLVQSLSEAFSIAYARYEDFKNLAAAKSRIEATLNELRSAQAQLIHSEKMASLGELTAGIAHEIKNPLNFINNFSELSQELLDEMKTELEKENKEQTKLIINNLQKSLQKINHHGKRADLIIKSMLLHSRGVSGEKIPANVNDLLDQFLNLAYHGMRSLDKDFYITFEKNYDDSLEKINIVPQDISRVFLNIINNAFYAVNEKRKKSIDHYTPVIKVSTKNLDNKVEIRIRDNGNGIPSSVKKQIFSPFFTTKPSGEGTGLGLSLSYDIIVKGHGGEIYFETEEEQFTEFIISLPF